MGTHRFLPRSASPGYGASRAPEGNPAGDRTRQVDPQIQHGRYPRRHEELEDLKEAAIANRRRGASQGRCRPLHDSVPAKRIARSAYPPKWNTVEQPSVTCRAWP